jgi:hypothetical protein
VVYLPTPLLAIARSCTDSEPIDNEESTDPKGDQAVGHDMQHASSLPLHSSPGLGSYVRESLDRDHPTASPQHAHTFDL